MWQIFGLVSLLLFVLGAVIGSFLNVVITRTVSDEPGSWLTGRSRCDHCQRKIAWYDNIPVLSFLLLRGECRHCHQAIGLNHPVVEVLTGFLFIWWYWVGSLFFQLSQRPFQTLQPLFWLTVGLLLLGILVADTLYYIIPDLLVWPLLGLVLLYRFILVLSGIMQLTDFGWSIVATTVLTLFFWSLWYFTMGRGFGFGDVKLAIPMGLLLGWPDLLVGVMAAFTIGAAVGVGLMLAGRKKLGQIVPFGPFLVVGTCIALLWGNQLVGWYVSLL